MRACTGVHEKKSTPFRRKRYYGCYELMKTLYGINNHRDSSFSDAKTSLYNEMALTCFINTIAIPQK